MGTGRGKGTGPQGPGRRLRTPGGSWKQLTARGASHATGRGARLVRSQKQEQQVGTLTVAGPSLAVRGRFLQGWLVSLSGRLPSGSDACLFRCYDRGYFVCV